MTTYFKKNRIFQSRREHNSSPLCHRSLNSSQTNFISQQFVTLSQSYLPRLQIYESQKFFLIFFFFVQCCVQLWAKLSVHQRGPAPFWCRGRGDRWKAERSYQGLIKNRLIFINFICHRLTPAAAISISAASFSDRAPRRENANSNGSSFTLSFIPVASLLSIFISPPGKGRTPRRRCTATSCSTTAREEVSLCQSTHSPGSGFCVDPL